MIGFLPWQTRPKALFCLFAMKSCAMEARVKSTVEYCFASGR